MQISELSWLTLGVAAIIIVPIAVLLGVSIAAAKQITQHTAEIWSAGVRNAGRIPIGFREEHGRRLARISGAVKTVRQRARKREESLQRLAEAGGVRR